MKKFQPLVPGLILTLSLALLSLSSTAYGMEVHQSQTITTEGGEFSINYLEIPLDGTYEFDVSLAEYTLGKTKELSDLAKKQGDEAVAAINGTYFAAYTDKEDEMFPYGNLMQDEKVLHTSNIGSTIGFKAGQTPIIGRGSIDAYVDIETEREYKVLVNHPTEQETTLVTYTPHFSKPYIDRPGVKLKIEDNQVSEVLGIDAPEARADIPSKGKLLYLGTSYYKPEESLIPGLRIETRYEFANTDADTVSDLEAEGFTDMVGAGPKLVSRGEKDVDITGDGFNDYERMSNKSARSLIGYDEERSLLIMGTVQRASQYDLAEIALELGLYEAMSLDGGASSGLYYENDYLTRPGRKLSNALVVSKTAVEDEDGEKGSDPETTDPEAIESGKDEKESEVQVLIDGEAVQFEDQRPFLDEQGRTQVPVRFISEELGAQVEWKEDEGKITLSTPQKYLELIVDESEYTLNGEPLPMDTAPRITAQGRTVVPLRFVSEGLGQAVDWDEETNTAIISTEIEETGNDDSVKLKDSDLETNIREKLDIFDEEITKKDIEKLTKLNLCELEISDLYGIQYAKNLEMLCITSNEINVLDKLKELENLKELNLNSIEIREVDSLKEKRGLLEIITHKYNLEDELTYDSDLEKIAPYPRNIYSYKNMLQNLIDMGTNNLEVVEIEKIGVSTMDIPIWSAKLGTGSKDIVVVGSLHGNEWLNTPFVVSQLETYLDYYHNDKKYAGTRVQNILDKYTIHFIPMANPDGIRLSQKGVAAFPDKKDKLLELNGGSYDFTKWKANIEGVDLNRNFPTGEFQETRQAIKRGDRIGNLNPGPAFYLGEKAKSEIETQVLYKYMTDLNLKMLLDYHSGGRHIFWAYGQQNSKRDREIARVIQNETGYLKDYINVNKNPNTTINRWVVLQKNIPGIVIETTEFTRRYHSWINYSCELFEEEYPKIKNSTLAALIKLDEL